MRLLIRLSGLASVGVLALAAGCTSTGRGPIVVNINDGGTVRALNVGGAPERSVDNCVTAAERTFRVAPGGVVVDSGTSTATGVYQINLKVGPKGRYAVCTVNDNGVVSDMVYKRAM